MYVRVLRETISDPVVGVEGDEELLQAAIVNGAPHLRLWVNAPSIVIGRGYARRLPRPVERIDELPVLVRSSGGEIVLHGPGVLNVSLAIPTNVWSGQIHEAFAGLSAGVANALIHLGWRASVGEIPNSYCPGDHDVAVAGKKVMGISQRRVREGVLVHGSLNVSIVPEQYSGVLERFYAAAGIDDRPDVNLIGTLHNEPAVHPSECPISGQIVTSMFDYWSDRMGYRWVEEFSECGFRQ